MTYLLDTNLLLCPVYEQNRLMPAARDLLLDEQNNFVFSVVRLWEVTIKNAKHPTTSLANAGHLCEGLLSLEYEELLVTGAHAIRTSSLLFYHRDPFDRLLVSQALQENLTLASVDKQLVKYGAPFIYVG